MGQLRFDPGKEADAANALIDQGVDVVFQHTDSPAPIQTAERRGVYAVGYASDMAHFGPKAVLTSIVNNWGPHYIQAAEGAIAGTETTGLPGRPEGRNGRIADQRRGAC